MNYSDFYKELIEYNKDKDILNEYRQAFKDYKKSQHRLELLPVYTIPGVDFDSYTAYLKGEKKPPEEFEKWYVGLKKDIDEGKDIKRVRLVEYPISKYINYATDWGYMRMNGIGVKVKMIFSKSKDDLLSILTTKVPMLKDYYLFDNTNCYLMEYDYLGRWYGVNKLPEKYLQAYIDLFEELYNKADNLKEAIKVIKKPAHPNI